MCGRGTVILNSVCHFDARDNGLNEEARALQVGSGVTMADVEGPFLD